LKALARSTERRRRSPAAIAGARERGKATGGLRGMDRIEGDRSCSPATTWTATEATAAEGAAVKIEARPGVL
jgi:hypothetical protein